MTKLEKAIEIYNALEIRKYDDMPVVEHVFSDRFERKMARLIKQQKKFYYPMLNSPFKRVVVIATLLALLLSATIMAIGPLRNGFLKWCVPYIISIQKSHS